ncbi:MAG: antitoxin component YwqK of YwqJK toxin-antitoxin module [Bacteroidia bacterium]|jgi:antitoxin component YwqK of YwqJK toxin-antitoxin module
MKHIKWIAPLVLIVGIWLYFQANQSACVESLNLIPDDALYVLETEQPIAHWKAFSESDIWEILKTHPNFINLTNDANYLDTLISDNAILFKWLDNRSLFISAHLTSSSDYDFLYVIGLSKKAKSEVVLGALKKVLKTSGYTTSEKVILDINVLSGTDAEGKTIYFGQIGNQFICSYSESILKKSIEASTLTKWLDQPMFKDVYEKVQHDGLCRLYFPYAKAGDLMQCYFEDGTSNVREIGQLLGVSAVDFEVDEGSCTFDGFTNLNSTSPSLLTSVLISGQSDNTVGEVLSNRTAWYLSFNYTSFNTFQLNIETSLKQSSEYEVYTKRQNQIETVLGISVQDDLMSWIGNEITVAQLRKNLTYNKSENAVILIKTDDISKARDRLSFVAQQVKKRTPTLFKQIDYRNYQIQYLEIKGFFKMFFGEAFNKITKPYYTTIGDYVVFSNSPYTLIGLIEDFENKRNLSSTSYYNHYVSASTTSSVSLFVSPTNLYPVLTPMIKGTNAKVMQSNQQYFEAFESMGIQLVSNGGLFKTHIFLLQKEEMVPIEQVDENKFQNLYKLYASERDINSAQFVLEWIEDGIYKRQFPGSKQIQIEAKTSIGVLDGFYKEFHLNGKLKTLGKYKKGRKKGTWKFYSTSGELVEKKKY